MTRETSGGVPVEAVRRMADLQADHRGPHLTQAELDAISDGFDNGIGGMVIVKGEELGFGLKAPVEAGPQPTVGGEAPDAEDRQSLQG